MADKTPGAPKESKGRIALYASLLTFILYLANIMLGKAKVVFHWQVWHLGNVAECLLLLLASTLLIVAALQREVRPGDNTHQPSPKGEKA